ncbi:6499_t:CDS:2 [Gigaspora margarita]|uniref:6499_t:CDS:1 n=1 Tax=Gigaspora margarita TaxID=4874 RepID=A0ABN7W4B7_GIGMA|nr:6499_t:CDS:2 [Gigaspora margarita]
MSSEDKNQDIEEVARQDFINNVLIDFKPGDEFYETESTRLKKYGQCLECNKIRTGRKWCRSCNAEYFRQAFSTWTSGNLEIDYFIQNSQIYATSSLTNLEWWPYDIFLDIEEIGRGGYGTVFRAKRKVQRIKGWDYLNNKLLRFEEKDFYEYNGFVYVEYVVLKTIGQSQILPKDFLNEAKRLQRWAYQSILTWGSPILQGFTKNDDTGQYYHVLEYYDKGDIRNIQNDEITWHDRIKIIYHVSKDMYNIHKAGLIHR